MELLALDSAFAPVAYLKYFNLQWTRRYYECGEFSVQIRAADYQSAMAYVYTRDRPETGIIQKVEYAASLKGEFVQLSGFFLESMLNDKIVYPTFYGRGNLETAARELVTAYKDDIPLLRLGGISGVGSSVTWQETGGQMADVLYETLQTQELSFRCRYSLEDDAVYYEVWQGLDRTQPQTANNPVTFSRTFRNLSGANIATDVSNAKNFAVVAGSGEEAGRIVAEVDLSEGGYKRKLYVDQRNLSYDPGEQTLDEYREELRQKGREKLLKYVGSFNADVDAVDGGGFVYLRDYDLGDKCDVIVDSVSLSLEARIIAVYEVVKQGRRTVSLELGDKVLTPYDKARL